MSAIPEEEYLYKCTSACAGCSSSLCLRYVLKAAGPDTVLVVPACCTSVIQGAYPGTAMNVPVYNIAFAAAAACASGMSNALRSLGKKTNVIVYAGDGGTVDIGLQSLSGAFERGTDFLYICYDNEAYMNTGIQRSSATPLYADTTTSATGKCSSGKQQNRKDLAEVIAAHHIPYVAQTTFIGNLKDMHEKAEKALYTPGAAFLNILAPCPRGWRYEAEDIMEVCKMAVETCFWPLFEVENDVWKVNYEPKVKRPVEDFLKLQGRFKHLFKKGNEDLIAQIQAEVDHRWEDLLKKAK